MTYSVVIISDREAGMVAFGKPHAGIVLSDPLPPAFQPQPPLDEARMPEIEVKGFVVPEAFSATISRSDRPDIELRVECGRELTMRSIGLAASPNWNPCPQCWQGARFAVDRGWAKAVSDFRFGADGCPTCGDLWGRMPAGGENTITREELRDLPVRETLQEAVTAATLIFGHTPDGRDEYWPLTSVRRILSVADQIAATEQHLAEVRARLRTLRPGRSVDEQRRIEEIEADVDEGERRLATLRLNNEVELALREALSSYLGSFGDLIPRPKRGRAITDEQLAEVARIYREAITDGKPPTGEVARQLHMARSTAGRWVQQARERGHLGKTSPRKRGEEPT